MLSFLLLASYGFLSFLAGIRWGHIFLKKYIDFLEGPVSKGRIMPGQRWRISGVGEIIVYDVWPESVTYFKAKGPTEQLYTVNREDFEIAARDMSGRDGLGRFVGEIEARVLKFELKRGSRLD